MHKRSENPVETHFINAYKSCIHEIPIFYSFANISCYLLGIRHPEKNRHICTNFNTVA